MRPIVVAALAAMAPIAAQAVEFNAIVQGDVLDADGIPVVRAGVTLESPELIGGARTALTDDDGKFRFIALPPGAYTIKVEHPSFVAWEQDFPVSLSATVTVHPTLAVRDSGLEMVVSFERPAVDTSRVSSGVSMSAEFIKNIPTGREYHGAVALTPGVVGSGNPNVRGGFDTGNQYYLDGINVTDPVTSTFSNNIHIDAIDSVQVLTGGMDAEYGRSLGGAVNIVTKSGGDEFHGSAWLTFQNPAMTSIAPALPGDGGSKDLGESLALTLGGPIKKERAWFFLSGQGDRFVSSTSYDPAEVPRDPDVYPMPAQDWRSLRLMGKVTVQPTDSHRMWLLVQTEPTFIDNADQNPYQLPSAEEAVRQGGWTFSLGHQFTPSDRLLIETVGYYQHSYIDYFPMLWKGCKNKDDRGVCLEDFVGTDYLGQPVTESWLPWDPDGFQSGAYPWAGFDDRWRASVNTSATTWFDALGHHQVKAGVQLEYMATHALFPGLETGIPYYTYGDGDPANLDDYRPQAIDIYDNDQEARLFATIGSAYVQDVWQPVPSLTIRPGVRFDLPALFNDVGTSVFSRPTLAPRFGVAWDPTNKGVTSIHAYYGRFFDTGYLIISDLLRSKSQGYSEYSWDERAGDWATEPDYTVGSTFLRAPNLKNPYSDEFDLGVSQEIGKDFAVHATFVYKESRRFWEDDEVNLIWNREGTEVIGFRNGEPTTLYRLRTPDQAFTRYTSLELMGEKTWSDGWGILASYTWSRAYGSQDADQATAYLDIPEQVPLEVGLLGYDRTHAIKLSGSYERDAAVTIGSLGLGYVFGWNAEFASGGLYRPVVFNDYYGGYSNFDDTPSDRYRLPMTSDVDVRTGVTFTVGPTDWFLGVEVGNVFNDRTVVAVNSSYDPDAVGADQPFGAVLARQGPRSLELFLNAEF